jgi:hypothetical protein
MCILKANVGYTYEKAQEQNFWVCPEKFYFKSFAMIGLLGWS